MSISRTIQDRKGPIALRARGAPVSITVDNGSELASRALDAWAYRRGIKLQFIRPGKPVENGYVESFDGRLRDECLNTHVFPSIEEMRKRLEAWRRDYDRVRPHSALGDRSLEAELISSPVRAQGSRSGCRSTEHRVPTLVVSAHAS